MDLPDFFEDEDLELLLKEWEILGLDPVVAKKPYWEGGVSKVATAVSIVDVENLSYGGSPNMKFFVKRADGWCLVSGGHVYATDINEALSAVKRERYDRDRRDRRRVMRERGWI